MRGSRFFFILLGVAVLGILAVIFFGAEQNQRGLPHQAENAAAPPVPPPPTAPDPGTVAKVAPSFDVVRISRNCTAVFAGRAMAGSVVVVKTGAREIGRVTADTRGEWVLVPDLPLERGNQEFVLESQMQGSQDVIRADASVVAVVPECQPGEGGEQAIAVLTPLNGASRLLQRPSEGPLDPARRGLALDAVEYDEKGNLILSGRAQAGSTVQVYLNNEPIGVASADAKGRWTMKPEKAVDPGIYSLRVDQVEQAGRVASRLELPFSRARPEDIQMGADGKSVVVQPGNSLWRISRQLLGEGLRYTEIYRANQVQIRDPDLIYPGQIFAVPNGNGGAASSQKSGTPRNQN